MERIHAANLVNFGILPLLFVNPSDYDRIEQGDDFVIEGIHAALDGDRVFTVKDATRGFTFQVRADVTPRQAAILKDGGLLNHIARGGK